MAASRSERRAHAVRSGHGGSAGASVTSIPLVRRVREQVGQELTARKDRASELIQGLAGTVRRVAEPLHDESLGPLGAFADEAAAQLERLAGRLRNREVSELADDLRRLARRRPGIYVAIGLAAGFAAARFLKSTGEARHHTRQGIAAERPRPGGQATAGGRGAPPSGSRGRSGPRRRHTR
jgi:hypothetical protein